MHNAAMDWEWFRDRKRELGLTDAQIAEAAGKERSVVTKILKGAGTFAHERADELSRAFMVSRLEILRRLGILNEHDISQLERSKRPPSAPADDDEVVEIVALDLSLSMGPGTIVDEFVEEEVVKMGLAFIQSITRTPSDRLRLVRGIGESMEPTLRSSDRVLIDINERQLTRLDGLYWIDHFGLHGLKRLRAAGRGRVRILSDNPSVPDDEVAADELLIHGRAIWFGRDL